MGPPWVRHEEIRMGPLGFLTGSMLLLTRVIPFHLLQSHESFVNHNGLH